MLRKRLVEENVNFQFEEAKQNFPEELNDESKKLDFWATTLTLKDYPIDQEELLDGCKVAGGQDGGIDALYIMVNGSCIQDEADLTPAGTKLDVEILIVQSKKSESISEKYITNLTSDLKMLIDPTKTEDYIGTQFNSEILRKWKVLKKIFHERLQDIESCNLTLHHVTLRVQEALSPALRRKIDEFERELGATIDGLVKVKAYGAEELFELIGSRAKQVKMLDVANAPSVQGEAFGIVLCNIESYANFISKDGSFDSTMIDANIRGYQGKKKDVNKEIRQTLQGMDGIDFWWLNNGVTIVVEDMSLRGGQYKLTDPQIVNGLQTSREVYEYFHSLGFYGGKTVTSDGRKILVKILRVQDINVERKVIWATNRQTPVSKSNLRSTDPLQGEIALHFETKGIKYALKSGEYLDKGVSRSEFFTIDELSQAIFAVLALEPNQSRRRGASLIKEDKDYESVFNSNVSLHAYYCSARILRKVEDYLKESGAEYPSEARRNLRFHVMQAISLYLAPFVGEVQERSEKVINRAKYFDSVSIEAIDTIDVGAIHDRVFGIFKNYWNVKATPNADTAAKNKAFENLILEVDWQSK